MSSIQFTDDPTGAPYAVVALKSDYQEAQVPFPTESHFGACSVCDRGVLYSAKSVDKTLVCSECIEDLIKTKVGKHA